MERTSVVNSTNTTESTEATKAFYCDCKQGFKDKDGARCEKIFVQTKENALILGLVFLANFLVSLVLIKIFTRKPSDLKSLTAKPGILSPRTNQDPLNSEESRELTKSAEDTIESPQFEADKMMMTADR